MKRKISTAGGPARAVARIAAVERSAVLANRRVLAMTSVVRIDRIGGPEVLSFQDISSYEPQTGEIAIRHTAIGVNYIDIYHRTGVYPLSLPATLGVEGAGVITALGTGVEGFAVGDRIAYAGGFGYGISRFRG